MTIFEYLLQADKDGRRAQLLHRLLKNLRYPSPGSSSKVGLKVIRVPYGKRFEVVES